MNTPHTDDHREIEECLYRYAWMVDQRRWELMDSVFTADGTIDYTSTGGKRGPYRPTLEWLDRALAAWPINLHMISNISIEFPTPDSARSRCYFFAPMGHARPDGTQEVISNAGYYADTLVRTSAGWRIRERLCTQTIMIGQLPPGYAIPE
jgi:3-phenylpropionate/cinnamic acid dioxygenase small subunit